MTDLAGFERVESIPNPSGGRNRKSKYDELIREVRKEGGIYAIDMGNRQHAQSMSTNLRHLLTNRGINDVVVSVRGIKVYVSRKED